MEAQLELRQHDQTRDEHTRMQQSLDIARSYLNSHRRKFTEEELEVNTERIEFLEHVLEFSGTWNGVETKEFFSNDPRAIEHLNAEKLERLGGFLAKPFSEVSKSLRAFGREYPFLLKKLYEAYYLRTLKRKSPLKNLPE